MAIGAFWVLTDAVRFIVTGRARARVRVRVMVKVRLGVERCDILHVCRRFWMPRLESFIACVCVQHKPQPPGPCCERPGARVRWPGCRLICLEFVPFNYRRASRGSPA